MLRDKGKRQIVQKSDKIRRWVKERKKKRDNNMEKRKTARSEGSQGTVSFPRVPGEKTTQDVTVTSWMTCAQQSFPGSIQTAIKDEVSMRAQTVPCLVS